MAKTITQRIALDGAENIKAQLKDIGATGATAFNQLQGVRGANAGLSELGRNIADGVQRLKLFGGAAADAGKAAVNFADKLALTLAKVTGLSAGLGVVAGKLLESFKKVGSEQEDLQQNADAIGLSTQEYQNLVNALTQGGVEAGDAAKALDKLAKFAAGGGQQLDEFRKKQDKLVSSMMTGKITSEQYRKELKELDDGVNGNLAIADRYGIKLTDNNGKLKSARDLLLEFGDALAKSDDKTQAAADSLALFGRGGRKISQIAQQGSESLKGLEREAGKIAPALTDGAKKAVDGMDNAFDRTGIITSSLKTNILAVFAPDVTQLVNTFNTVLTTNREKFLAVAKSVREQLQPIIEKLLLALNSPDAGSLITAGLESIVTKAKAVGIAFTDYIVPGFLKIKAAADTVALTLNNLFGTKLTGGILIATLLAAKFSGVLALLGAGASLAASLFTLFGAAVGVVLPILVTLATALFSPIGIVIALAVAIGTLVGLILKNFPEIGATVSRVFGNIIGIFTQFPGNVSLVFTAAVTAITGLFDSLKGYFVEWWNYTTDNFARIVNAISGFFKDGFEKIKGYATAAKDWIVEKYNDAINKVKEFLGLQDKAVGGADGTAGAQKNAAGGFIRGAGTGTSDSILSWLSNGEFVVKADAVRHYGPQLLAAINGMRLPKFATGGAVTQITQRLSTPIPRFAAGGMVPALAASGGDQRPFTLQIGDDTFDGMTASASAIEQLTRYSSAKQVRSAGRKPSWHKG